jgi:hypothetical protein
MEIDPGERETVDARWRERWWGIEVRARCASALDVGTRDFVVQI